ncbi:hypothetical protein [Desulfovibrio gilichinskyi]|uniref:hypothetical protein n=1 Tax=Desulfovibrio gilichinskyi TaxID=1519643 RepID=UPI0010F4D75E|nr:hypothetical protein [Desulfovibrio gilichinskyi]
MRVHIRAHARKEISELTWTVGTTWTEPVFMRVCKITCGTEWTGHMDRLAKGADICIHESKCPANEARPRCRFERGAGKTDIMKPSTQT